MTYIFKVYKYYEKPPNFGTAIKIQKETPGQMVNPASPLTQATKTSLNKHRTKDLRKYSVVGNEGLRWLKQRFTSSVGKK